MHFDFAQFSVSLNNSVTSRQSPSRQKSHGFVLLVYLHLAEVFCYTWISVKFLCNVDSHTGIAKVPCIMYINMENKVTDSVELLSQMTVPCRQLSLLCCDCRDRGVISFQELFTEFCRHSKKGLSTVEKSLVTRPSFKNLGDNFLTKWPKMSKVSFGHLVKKRHSEFWTTKTWKIHAGGLPEPFLFHKSVFVCTAKSILRQNVQGGGVWFSFV